MKSSLKTTKFAQRYFLFLLTFFLLVGANVADAKKSNKAEAKEARKIYNRYCISCHLSGSSGAPRFKRQKEWAPRILQGRPTLYQHAIEGFGKMEPKGGFANLTDEQVKLAVDYILNALPKPPAN